MPQTAFITGADRGLDFALTTQLLEQGWQSSPGNICLTGLTWPH